MIHHIDLSSVLRRSVCALYSNLVTRPTGVAVRSEIEQLVADCPGRTLTVIDFTHVGLLDYSCADEVVAKLLLKCDGYFVFRGLHEAHIDAIETTLARYDLALVVEQLDGSARLVGTVGDAERLAWQMVHRWGRADAPTLAATLGTAAPEAERLLDTLSTRRLLVRLNSIYLPIGSLQ
ncbi:MAG TPA: hypothetical protein VNW46_07320 [Gemmatimonadaceae bacterium]|nr:hypothetical protein [Gemmatimonadaceae bacterium]